MSDVNDNDDDGGLYDDVHDVKLASTDTVTISISSAPPANGVVRPQHPLLPDQLLSRPRLSLTDQVEDLQLTVHRLERENETLKRNMGTLFRTAAAEVARKDRLLQDLRRELDLTGMQQAK